MYTTKPLCSTRAYPIIIGTPATKPRAIYYCLPDADCFARDLMDTPNPGNLSLHACRGSVKHAGIVNPRKVRRHQIKCNECRYEKRGAEPVSMHVMNRHTHINTVAGWLVVFLVLYISLQGHTTSMQTRVHNMQHTIQVSNLTFAFIHKPQQT